MSERTPSHPNMRWGMRFFVLYSLLYLGFMILNTFTPNIMEWSPFAGVNLAVWYGFGLIGSAIALALVYGWICRQDERNPSTTHEARR